jgi:hypothetical protein
MGFQIIGLLGQAGSGKDVVADWFYNKGFLKMAFSDPMKRYAKDLFGYDREQLWGPSEFRNRDEVATDEWWFNVVSRWGKATNKFVNELFDATFSNGKIGRVEAYYSLCKWLAQLRLWSQEHGQLLSPRVVLQTLGTEWGRNLHENLWTSYAYEKVIPKIKEGWSYGQEYGLEGPACMTGCPGVVIADHRFFNEAMATSQMGGFVMRLSRPGAPKKEQPGIQGHASEIEQKAAVLPVGYELELPEGLDKVNERLERLWRDKPWAPSETSDKSPSTTS